MAEPIPDTAHHPSRLISRQTLEWRVYRTGLDFESCALDASHKCFADISWPDFAVEDALSVQLPQKPHDLGITDLIEHLVVCADRPEWGRRFKSNYPNNTCPEICYRLHRRNGNG